MNIVIKIVNKIVGRSALHHRQFKCFLEEIESEYGDLLMHTDIRWLSRGQVLTRFLACIEAIQIFLIEIKENFPQLEDKSWLLKLKFLTDITNHFNSLNSQLQGKKHTVLKLFECWKGFCLKLSVFENDIKSKILKYFPSIKTHEGIEDVDMNIILEYISAIKTEFDARFEDLKTYGPMFSFIIKPDEMDLNELDLKYFEYLGINNLELEYIEFKWSVLWTNKFKDLRQHLENTENDHMDAISSCWSTLPQNFICLKKLHLLYYQHLVPRILVSKHFPK